VLCLGLLLPVRLVAAEYVELTAELQIDSWAFWFLQNKETSSAELRETTNTVFTPSWPVRCVVGSNTWMIENDYTEQTGQKVTRWFTGTNIIESTLITRAKPEEYYRRFSQAQATKLAMTAPRVGSQHTRVYETRDGNPGRSIGATDLIMDLHGMIPWMAFCSGPALKREGRRVPLPSAMWKHYFPDQFTDNTACFDDSLGLPMHIDVFTKKGQRVLQYQVRRSTNVLGWDFPLEFYLVQYTRASWPQTNSMEVHFTAKGKTTAIKPGDKPHIPEEVLTSIER
jgi:hypothetical protein